MDWRAELDALAAARKRIDQEARALAPDWREDLRALARGATFALWNGVRL